MPIKKITSMVALAALASGPAMAQGEGAAATGAAPAPVEITQADVDFGLTVIDAINAGLSSESVPQSIKQRLFVCVYNSQVGGLSRATKSVIDSNEQLKADNLNDVVNALIAVCKIPVPEQAPGDSTENR